MARRQTGIIVHGIGRPRRDREPGEAPYWISEAQFALLLDRIAALPDPETVRITFDDGNLSDHDIALPALAARGLRAEFFVLTGRIGQPGSLTADHIRALIAAGMGVGSHGEAHLNWTRLGPAALERELTGSRRALEAICGRAIEAAAIPFGAYDGRVLRALRRAGYRRVYSSDRGRMDPAAFLCPRGSVTGATRPEDFAALISGRLPPGRRLRRALSMALRRI